MAKPYMALATLHEGAKSGPAVDNEALGVHVKNTRCGTLLAGIHPSIHACDVLYGLVVLVFSTFDSALLG